MVTKNTVVLSTVLLDALSNMRLLSKDIIFIVLLRHLMNTDNSNVFLRNVEY